MKIAILAILSITVALAACRGLQGSSPPAGPPLDSPHVKIWVSKSGTVELDGKPTELAVVESTLATLAKKKGVVLYGRDGASEEPHPNGMKVIEMAVANGLPIRMSTKSDFSDAVGPDGKLKE
jgi:biopolymer transport protein ExbD